MERSKYDPHIFGVSEMVSSFCGIPHSYTFASLRCHILLRVQFLLSKRFRFLSLISWTPKEFIANATKSGLQSVHFQQRALKDKQLKSFGQLKWECPRAETLLLNMIFQPSS